VAVRERLEEAGMRVVQTPYAAPNANAYAERFVRSIKEECLDRIIPIGEEPFRRAVSEFVAHYHRERNHQGLENALIGPLSMSVAGRVYRHSRLGALHDEPVFAWAEQRDITGLTFATCWQYIQCRYMAATTTQIAKWGNSLGLRLPKSVALEADVDEGDTVDVSVRNGAIVIRPSRPRYSLERLVAKITPHNRHNESDWGMPVGQETW
jgi:antitoxin MazE